MRNQFVVCKNCCLFEAIHAFFDFNVNLAVERKSLEVIFFDDIGRKYTEWNFHVFWAFHGGGEEMIF